MTLSPATSSGGYKGDVQSLELSQVLSAVSVTKVAKVLKLQKVEDDAGFEAACASLIVEVPGIKRCDGVRVLLSAIGSDGGPIAIGGYGARSMNRQGDQVGEIDVAYIGVRYLDRIDSDSSVVTEHFAVDAKKTVQLALSGFDGQQLAPSLAEADRAWAKKCFDQGYLTVEVAVGSAQQTVVRTVCDTEFWALLEISSMLVDHAKEVFPNVEHRLSAAQDELETQATRRSGSVKEE